MGSIDKRFLEIARKIARNKVQLYRVTTSVKGLQGSLQEPKQIHHDHKNKVNYLLAWNDWIYV